MPEESGRAVHGSLLVEADKLGAGPGSMQYAQGNVGGDLARRITYREDILDEIVALVPPVMGSLKVQVGSFVAADPLQK
jgi:hypothetical protein